MVIQEVATYNFNAPLALVEVFKFEKHINTGEKIVNEEGDLVDNFEQGFEEFIRTAYVLWEDLSSISAYPYADNWDNQGEKFFVEARGRQLIVLGSMDEILELWTMYRTLHGPNMCEPYVIKYKLENQNDSGGGNTTTPKE